MTLFRYEAVDAAGKPVSGVMNSTDPNAVVERLRGMGYTARRVFPAPGQQVAPPAAARAPVVRDDLPVSLPSSVRLRSLATFLRRFATSIRAGIPVSQVVADLARTSPSGKLRRAAQDMSDRMTRGAKLGEAMTEHPRIFPAHISGLILAGEVGGFLDIALDEAASSLEQEAKEKLLGWFIRLIWWGIVIPLPFLLPMFKAGEILERAGRVIIENENLGLSARLAVILGAYWQEFVHIGLPVLVVIAAWRVFQTFFLARSQAVRRTWDGFVLGMPVFGRIARGKAIARFSSSLGRLYKAGVAPDLAWNVACRTAPNYQMAARLYRVRSLMASGQTVHSALSAAQALDYESLALIASAENAGSLPEALERISASYADGAHTAQRQAQYWNTSIGCLATLLISGVLTALLIRAWIEVQLRLADWITRG